MPLFVKRPVDPQFVEAHQLPPGAQATVTQGRPPRPGDYVVTDHVIGSVVAMLPEEFAAMYMPASIPSAVLADEHRAQQEQATASGTYAPQVTYDPTRMPGFTGQTATTAGGSVVPVQEAQSSPPPPGGFGDVSPVRQPITESLPGRPSPTPEVRPRLGDQGENTPVESPTGLPAQPGDADKAHTEEQTIAPEEVGEIPPEEISEP